MEIEREFLVRITKTRYDIPSAGKTIELDVYGGRHRGLMTAKVEFPSKRSAEAFEPPDWIGKEVTGNPRYSNAALALRGRP